MALRSTLSDRSTSTLTFVDCALTTLAALVSPLLRVRPEKLSTSWPFSTTRSVNGDGPLSSVSPWSSF